MDLTPGEKAVLAQIRVLYATAGGRDQQQVKALLMQWPPTHYDAYRRAYGSLLAKQLIQDADGQSFRITDAGLKAIGVAAPRPVSALEESRPVAPAPRAETPAKAKRAGVLSRFVTGLLGQKT